MTTKLSTSLALTLPLVPLRKAIERLSRIVEKRNTVPILANVAIAAGADGSVTLRAMDLDISATARLAPGTAAVSAPGETTVPAILLLDILKKSSGEISFEDNGEGRAAVKAGRSRFTLHSLPASDLPDLSAGARPDFDARFSLSPAKLRRIAACLSFAISTEETRYYLNGIFLHFESAPQAEEQTLVAVATDGHRLSRLRLPGLAVDGTMPPVIVPAKTVGLFETIAASAEEGETIAVSVSQSRIGFETAALSLVSKLIDGQYPDYQRAIPAANGKRVTLSRAPLAAAIDRVSTISAERRRCVRFAFGGAGALELGCFAPDAGEAKDGMEATGDIEPIEIGFSAAYAASILASFAGETVEIALADPATAALITDPADGDRLVVLMPMRVS